MATPNPTTADSGAFFVDNVDDVNFGSFAASERTSGPSIIRTNGGIYLTCANKQADDDGLYFWYSSDGETWTECATSTTYETSALDLLSTCMFYSAENEYIYVVLSFDDSAGADDKRLITLTFSGTDVTIKDNDVLAATTEGPAFAIFACAHESTSGTDRWWVMHESSGSVDVTRGTFDGTTTTISSTSTPGYTNAGDDATIVWEWDTSVYNPIGMNFTDATEQGVFTIGIDSNRDLVAAVMEWATAGGGNGTFQNAHVINTGTYDRCDAIFSPTQGKYFAFAKQSATAAIEVWSATIPAGAGAVEDWAQETSLTLGASTDGVIQVRYNLATDVVDLLFNNDDGDLDYYKYDCAGDSWSAETAIHDGTTRDVWSLGICQDESGSFMLNAIWVDTSAQEWLVNFVGNQAPTATFTSPTDGTNQETNEELLLIWNYSDPESDAQTHYRIRRVIDALTTEYWNGTGWDASEAGSNKIASANTQVTIPGGWGDPSTQTSHDYSIRVWDAEGNDSGYTDTITLYPFSNDSTNKGFSMPRPYKKQENVLATLKSNTDYTLAWMNNYVPTYGDLNDDLYIREGLRPGGTSTMRSMFPPVVGTFSVGNGTSYFQDLGATNVYRSNELALSSEKAKEFFESVMGNALGLVLSVPVEEFTYLDDTRNFDAGYRFGIVLEDLKHTIRRLGINDRDSAFIIKDKNGDEFVNTEQLLYVLWQAVQELYDIADPSGQRREARLVRVVNRVRSKFKRKKNNQI